MMVKYCWVKLRSKLDTHNNPETIWAHIRRSTSFDLAWERISSDRLKPSWAAPSPGGGGRDLSVTDGSDSPR